MTARRKARVHRTPSGMLLRGDCLGLVPQLVSQPDERFDLVYLDPPFNTGCQRRARVGRGQRAGGPSAYTDRWTTLDGFLAMLEPRLMVLRDVLSNDGSLWLHLDHRTVHDAKVLSDRVFCRDGFRGEIIWVPGNGGRLKNGPSITHQTILIYARGARMIFDDSDPMLREPYAGISQKMHFRHVDSDGRRYRVRVVGGKAYHYYADHGRRIGSVWSDCPAMRANTPLIREATGYPTQKPEKLLERIIRAASRPGGRVLDPMCGSGTTLVVAERLGRRWVGIDQSEMACAIARRRLAAPNPVSGTRGSRRE